MNRILLLYISSKRHNSTANTCSTLKRCDVSPGDVVGVAVEVGLVGRVVGNEAVEKLLLVQFTVAGKKHSIHTRINYMYVYLWP